MDNMEFLTIKDVQKILRIGRDKAYRLVSTKGFPKITLGGTVRIPKAEFEKWVENYAYSKFNM
mgnify:CR=1 FL=1